MQLSLSSPYDGASTPSRAYQMNQDEHCMNTEDDGMKEEAFNGRTHMITPAHHSNNHDLAYASQDQSRRSMSQINTH